MGLRLFRFTAIGKWHDNQNRTRDNNLFKFLDSFTFQLSDPIPKSPAEANCDFSSEHVQLYRLCVKAHDKMKRYRRRKSSERVTAAEIQSPVSSRTIGVVAAASVYVGSAPCSSSSSLTVLISSLAFIIIFDRPATVFNFSADHFCELLLTIYYSPTNSVPSIFITGEIKILVLHDTTIILHSLNENCCDLFND